MHACEQGCWVYNKVTGKYTRIYIRNDVLVIPLWIKKRDMMMIKRAEPTSDNLLDTC